MNSTVWNDNDPDRSRLRTLRLGIGLAGLLCGGLVHAEAPATDGKALYEHIMKARQIAGKDLQVDFNHRCFIETLYPLIAKGINAVSPVPPAKVMDNVYFVGQNNVSSWVVKTSQGLIVIDTLNTPDEAKEYIEGGMTKLGLDPTQIKYIILTHEHADHFGGSRYLQEKYRQYGAHVVASAAAWKSMHPATMPPPSTSPEPCGQCNYQFAAAQDIVASDGEKITLGDTTVTFYLTPGHTDGTLSFIFNVSDQGSRHVIGFFGGMGSPRTEENRDKIVRSYERWLKLTAAAGADTLIANHPGMDHAVEYADFDRLRHAGDPNPFVLGKDAFQRYFEIQAECTRADLARNGEKMPD
jgi:metallo-beta-lactamase class B